MKMSDDVMNDLLTLYSAGEASADTKALLESHARQHAAFASRLEAAGALPPLSVPHSNPPGDLELRTLTDTRKFILLRSVFLAAGIFFSLLPLVFTFDKNGVEFLVLGRHAGLMWSFWSIAVVAWTAWYVMHRHVRQVGL